MCSSGKNCNNEKRGLKTANFRRAVDSDGSLIEEKTVKIRRTRKIRKSMGTKMRSDG